MSTIAATGETTQVVILENGSPVAFADPTQFTMSSGMAIRERRVLGKTEFELEVDFGGHSMSLTIPMITQDLIDAMERYEQAVFNKQKRFFSIGVSIRFPESGAVRTITLVDIEFSGPSIAISNATDGVVTLECRTGKQAVVS